jgi:hypothetical protein
LLSKELRSQNERAKETYERQQSKHWQEIDRQLDFTADRLTSLHSELKKSQSRLEKTMDQRFDLLKGKLTELTLAMIKKVNDAAESKVL